MSLSACSPLSRLKIISLEILGLKADVVPREEIRAELKKESSGKRYLYERAGTQFYHFFKRYYQQYVPD
jgi:hypothetical protein